MKKLILILLIFSSSIAHATPFTIFQGVYRGEGDFRGQPFSYSIPAGCALTLEACPSGFAPNSGVCLSTPFESFVLVPLSCDTEQMPIGTSIDGVIQVFAPSSGGGVYWENYQTPIMNIEQTAQDKSGVHQFSSFDCPPMMQQTLSASEYVIEAYSSGSTAWVSLFVFRSNTCEVSTNSSQSPPGSNTPPTDLTQDEQTFLDRMKSNILAYAIQFRDNIVSKFNFQIDDAPSQLSFNLFGKQIDIDFSTVPGIGAAGDLVYTINLLLASLYVIRG